jgi:hypothetical protein
MAQGPSVAIVNNAEMYLALGDLGKAAQEADRFIQQTEKTALRLEKKMQQLDPKLQEQLRKAERISNQAHAGLAGQQSADRAQRDALEAVTDSRKALRTVERVDRVFNNPFFRKIIRGEAIDGKEVLREFIYSDRLAKDLAQHLGAGDKIIERIGQVALVGKAALLGWEIGSAIREQMDKRDDIEEKLTSGVVRQTEKKKLFESYWFTGNGEDALKKIEAGAAVDRKATMADVTKALIAKDRDVSGGSGQLQVDELSSTARGIRNQRYRASAAIFINETARREEEEKKRQNSNTLDDKTEKAIREEVLSYLKNQGALSPEEAESIKNAHHEEKKSLSQQYRDRREKEMYEASNAVFDKRVPASPMD